MFGQLILLGQIFDKALKNFNLKEQISIQIIQQDKTELIFSQKEKTHQVILNIDSNWILFGAPFDWFVKTVINAKNERKKAYLVQI